MQGIYQIRNIENNKVYIGSSIDIEVRWKSHKNLLKNNKHHSIKLQNDWNEYGENSFIFEVLEKFNKTSRTQLYKLEQDYINTYEPHIKGYNINSISASAISEEELELSKYENLHNIESNIRKVGNSLGVLIPNTVIKEMNLSNGSNVFITYEDDEIVIRKDKIENTDDLEKSKVLIKEEFFDDMTIQIKIIKK